ncbi:MAG: hypothetical protein J7M21_01630, partial [Planctomycetes bacterium]|nr:hypothetical protein [Planctomycetota bacterium]
MASIPLVTLLAASLAASTGHARVETIDARTLTGLVEAVSSERLTLLVDGRRRSIPAGEVLEIHLAEPADAMGRKGQAVLVTDDGDVLAAADVAFDGSNLHVNSPLLGPIDLPVGCGARIYTPASSQSAEELGAAWSALKLPVAAGDRVVVAKAGGQLMSVDGLVEAIDATSLTMRWQGRSRRIARKIIRLVRLAPSGSRTAGQAAAGTVLWRDGSKTSFSRLSVEAGKARLVLPAGGSCTAGLEQVAAVVFHHPGVVKLASLKPAAVREYGFFDTTFHYRVNREVGGGPIRLDGRTYRTGLGLHSFCELTWKLQGRYD